MENINGSKDASAIEIIKESGNSGTDVRVYDPFIPILATTTENGGWLCRW